MQLFYTTNIKGDYAYLDEVEARHVVQVLRKKVGDPLQFVDGKSNWYEGVIDETSKKKCVVLIKKTIKNYQPRPFNLHIAIAPTKNIARLEWFLEKCTEIGIDEITPIWTKHSERNKVRMDRLEKVIIAAMKQSLKAKLPNLHQPQKLKEFIENNDSSSSVKLIAHCEEIDKKSINDHYQKDKDVVLLIGPEGDFSTDEIDAAIAAGFLSTTLGNSRLRTETAGVFACTVLNFMNSIDI